VISLSLSNQGSAALLEVYKFNSSSDFYINGTFGTSGNGTYLTISANKVSYVKVVFFNLTQAAGIVLVDKYHPWKAMIIFYIPSNSPQYKALYQY